MKNLLFVTETKGYLILSLKEKLQGSYNVITVSAKVDEISKIKEPLSAILIYGDEDLLAKRDSLTYLKDRAAEDDIAVFATVGRYVNYDKCSITGSLDARKLIIIEHLHDEVAINFGSSNNLDSYTLHLRVAETLGLADADKWILPDKERFADLLDKQDFEMIANFNNKYYLCTK